MARKKATEHKYRNPELNTPIFSPPPSIVLQGDESRKQISDIETKLLAERLRKFDLLFAEFDIVPGKGADYIASAMTLAFILACRYVRGLQAVDRRPGPGAPKGRGIESDSVLLLGMIDLAKRQFGFESDKKTCKWMVLAQNPELESARRKTARDKRVRTLANLVSKARKDAATVRH